MPNSNLMYFNLNHAITKNSKAIIILDMKAKTILNIGFDDTDSKKAMCTTFLAYKVVNSIKKEGAEFLDFPHLIRFNPNIPWKTRGNGAIAISIRTNKPKKIKKIVKKLVTRYSDIKGGANPGLVFYEKEKPEKNFSEFSESALCKLISRKKAKNFASKNKIETLSLGNGQGIVGAIGAIGYKFNDHTFELLTYRTKSQFGKKREIDKESVRLMQEKTFPFTFNSYDTNKNKILITPHGPDPVFYGIRGENPKSVINASRLIETKEKLEGYMTFKTNQGTSDHLKNEIDVNDFKPFTSGTIKGIVSKKPCMKQGKHVFFSIKTNNREILCAVYRPTKITSTVMELKQGDKILVGGGVRKASKKHKRILNVEFIKVLKLVTEFKLVNPLCTKCKKRMKSKGKNQGYQCVKCGKKTKNKKILKVNREIKQKLYLPDISAHRHLTRPMQRMGISNKIRKFDNRTRWIQVF